MVNHAKTPTTKKPVAGQLNLVLPPELLSFVDTLAVASAPPGVTYSRQDAIRSTLAKLQQQMATQQKPTRKGSK